MVSKGCQDLFVRAYLAGGVPVHAAYFCFREKAVQKVFHALSPVARRLQLRSATWAIVGRKVFANVAAKMAFQNIVPFVISQRYGTARAFQTLVALRAYESRHIAAAVQKKDSLFPLREALLQSAFQRPGDDRELRGDLRLFVKVYEFRLNVSAGADAICQPKQGVFSNLGVVNALKGGRGGSEYHRAILQLGAHDGQVPGVVIRCLTVLLVAAFVLFVHDYAAEIGYGRKNRGARAHDDFCFTFLYAPPLAMAFLVALGAVQNGHFRSETAAEAVGGLGSKGDLRNKDYGCLVILQRLFDYVKINFRFAAAGDAVQKERGEGVFLFQDFRHSRLLALGQFRRNVWERGFFVPQRPVLLQRGLQNARFFQRSYGSDVALRPFLQLLEEERRLLVGRTFPHYEATKDVALFPKALGSVVVKLAEFL